jgi:phosphohistidine phosphatase
MHLYLVQHAEAKPVETDPTRGLTPKGIADVQSVAAQLGKLNLGIKSIYHSGKKRASDTASILTAELKPAKGSFEAEGLGPQDDPKIWQERLKAIDEDVILVGHLPHLRRLASLLLCGDSEKSVVHFKQGGMVCLNRMENGWSLEWAVSPELFT